MSTLSFKKTWRIPFWLGFVTLFGLLAALLGTGYWYWTAWVLVGLPLVVIIRNIFVQKN